MRWVAVHSTPSTGPITQVPALPQSNAAKCPRLLPACSSWASRRQLRRQRSRSSIGCCVSSYTQTKIRVMR